MIGVLIGEQPCEEELGKMPYDYKGRDWVKQPQAKAYKKLPANHQKLGFRERAYGPVTPYFRLLASRTAKR